MNKPLGATLNFQDGEWVGPYAILTFVLMFGGIDFGKAVLFLMFGLLGAHILIEHKRVMKSKDVINWRLYTAGSFIGSVVLVYLIMPIFALISYTVFISHIKHTVKDEALYQQKSKTYLIMCGLTVAASVIFAIKGVLAADEVRKLQSVTASIEAEAEQLDERVRIQKLPAQ